MKITTIARNRKAFIEALLAKSTSRLCFTLDTNFAGFDVSVDCLRKALWGDGSTGKLTQADDRPGLYTIHIHGNRWYEFRVPSVPVELHPACCGCADCEARYAA